MPSEKTSAFLLYRRWKTSGATQCGGPTLESINFECNSWCPTQRRHIINPRTVWLGWILEPNQSRTIWYHLLQLVARYQPLSRGEVYQANGGRQQRWIFYESNFRWFYYYSALLPSICRILSTNPSTWILGGILTQGCCIEVTSPFSL